MYKNAGGERMENLDLLVNELRKLPNETPWVEFAIRLLEDLNFPSFHLQHFYTLLR